MDFSFWSSLVNYTRGCVAAPRTERLLRYRRAKCSSPLHLRQRRLGLGSPEGHVDGTVEADGGSQGDAGLCSTAGLVVQPAQPVVTVGLERAHTEFVGQGEGLLVVGFGQLERWGLALRGDLAEES